MRILKVLWEVTCWVGAIYLLTHFPVAVIMVALVLLASLPLKRLFMEDNSIEELNDVDAATSVTKVGALVGLTQMTTVKSIVYASRNKRTAPNPNIKLLDISTTKGE